MTQAQPNAADRERARSDLEAASARVQVAHEALAELMPPARQIDGNDHSGLQDREAAKTEVVDAESALAALGDVENLAIRYMTSRGQVAYDIATQGALKSARDNAAEQYDAARRALEAAALDPNAGPDELFVAWCKLRTTYESHLTAVDVLNFVPITIRGTSRNDGATAKSWAQFVEEVIAARVANAARITKARILETVSDAGNKAVARVTKS